MLHMHVRGVHSSSAASSAPAPGAAAAATGAAAASERPVFVKVGDSPWSPFEPASSVLAMHRIKLLEALAASKTFEVKLKGVDLSACTVAVVKNEKLGGADEPAPEHEAGDNVVELKLAKTVGSVAAAAGSDTAGAPLFIRVHVPPPSSE
jgi:hypothetical protein